MTRTGTLLRRSLLVSFLSLICLGAGVATAQETALDRYVAAPDPTYRWEIVGRHPGDGHTTFVLDLTSQTWRSADEVDRPVWKHWLVVVRPDGVKSDLGFLFIGGSNNNQPAPTSASERVVPLALNTGTVVAELFTVPNQPLAFADSPDANRYEDDLVAYSRVKYFETKDPTWLVRLPMVKSGVRAMDAMQELLASEAGGGIELKRFMVAGGSKRGWTTWLVGVVDERVVAIAPLVIDALNSTEITRHHYRAYGFFSPALDDYVRHGLFPDKVGTPEYREILAIEDPYHYRHRERLTIPKYVVNSAGDQFFLPDNSRFYFADLPQEKHLRYIPNTKHSLAGSDVRESLQAYYETLIGNHPRPRVTWTTLEDRSLRVTSDVEPREVLLWQAHNPEARDFRLDTIGPAWTSQPLTPVATREYLGRVPPPEKGFSAFFVELAFDGPGEYPLKFTTDVSVVPDVLPYEFPEFGQGNDE